MIIGDHFVFVHNPRCGGSVLRESLQPHHTHPSRFWHPRPAPYFGTLLDFAHLRLWEVATMFPDVFERICDGPSFVFVRNPLTRFLSALHHHFNQREALWDLEAGEKLELFRGFVAAELSPQRILTEPGLVHFNRQKWFLALGNRLAVQHIIPFDGNPLRTVQSALGIPLDVEAWRTPSPPETILVEDPILTRFAREYYAPDYELLASLPACREMSLGGVFQRGKRALHQTAASLR